MLSSLLKPSEILEDVWARLLAGKSELKHAFHTAALASINELEGVTVRTVVLRKVDVETRQIAFHTDRRSPKFADLLHDPAAAWLFYDAKARLQIRVRTSATLHTKDAVAHEQWVGLPEHAHGMYRSSIAPGEVLDQMAPPPIDPTTVGRDNFAVVACRIESIDWLYLHPEGHRRVRFTWMESEPKAEWLAP